MLDMPFDNPATYKGHSGVDFGQPQGALVLASDEFIVTNRGWINDRAGYGVIVRYHNIPDTPSVLYCHFKDMQYVPAVGYAGEYGEVIGTVGSTGNSTGPHLHMEIVGGAGAHTYEGIWNYFDRRKVVSVAVTLADNEANYLVIAKAIDRALRWDVRRNAFGADAKNGATVWDRLGAIQNAVSGLNVDLDERDVDKIVSSLVASIPEGIADKVADEFAKRLGK